MSISIIYDKCGSKHKKVFKEEESFKKLKILGIINNIDEHQKINMTESRLEEIDKKNISSKK